MDALVREEATAPQPTSPKLAMMLCLRADQMCLLDIVDVEVEAEAGWEVGGGGEGASRGLWGDVGHGMNSTRSQRF